MKNKKNEFILKDEYDFSNGIRGRFYAPTKKSITIRLDDDIIISYKKRASEEKIGYQTLIISTLREQIVQYRTKNNNK